jgi:hypothetical protein
MLTKPNLRGITCAALEDVIDNFKKAIFLYSKKLFLYRSEILVFVV